MPARVGQKTQSSSSIQGFNQTKQPEKPKRRRKVKFIFDEVKEEGGRELIRKILCTNNISSDVFLNWFEYQQKELSKYGQERIKFEPKTESKMYQIACEINVGRYSEVFMAFKNGTEAVALKIMKPFEVKGKETGNQLHPYIREYLINQLLIHDKVPNILPMKSIMHTDKANCVFVFPLLFRAITGDGLRALCKRAKWMVLKKILETLQKAHSIGIAHCDIDPSNILVDRWSYSANYVSVHLIDWGNAVIINDGRLMTIGHEQYRLDFVGGGPIKWRHKALFTDRRSQRGQLDIDYREVDLWAFGCFAHWLIMEEELMVNLDIPYPVSNAFAVSNIEEHTKPFKPKSDDHGSSNGRGTGRGSTGSNKSSQDSSNNTRKAIDPVIENILEMCLYKYIRNKENNEKEKNPTNVTELYGKIDSLINEQLGSNAKQAVEAPKAPKAMDLTKSSIGNRS